MNLFYKISKKTVYILFTLLFIFHNSYGQGFKEIDTLYNNAKKIKFTEPQKAVSKYTQFYKEALLKKDTTRAIKGLLEIGNIYSHNVNYSKSYDHLWKALLLAEKHQKKFLKGRIHQQLGWLYGFFNRKEEALKHFNLSLKITKNIYQKKKVPYTYVFSDHFGVANFYRIKNNYTNYTKHIDSCLQLINQVKEKNTNFYLEAELAYIKMHEGKHDEAINKLLNTKVYFQKNDPTYLVIVEHLLGKTYKAMNDYNKSIKAYNNSLKISNQYNCHADYRILNCDDLVEVYKTQKNYKKAFLYLQKSKEMNENIFGSKTENNQDLLLLKDSFRTTKEDLKKQETKTKIQLLEQEKSISFLKLIITITLAIFTLIFVLFFIDSIKKKHQTEKKTIAEKQRLELKRKNEILELKNKELTTSALQLIEKEEFLKNLQNKLNKQDESVNTKVVSKMINTIQGNPNSNWKEFETRFTLINQDFYKNLRTKFPSLSQTDLKICALVKLNFTGKEMSSLLGISVESVHTSRYRLRKKLGLKKEQNLSDFIDSI